MPRHDYAECPICGAMNSVSESSCRSLSISDGMNIVCQYYGFDFDLDNSVEEIRRETNPDKRAKEIRRRYNIIVSFLLKRPFTGDGKTWCFIYDKEPVSTTKIEKSGIVRLNIANEMADYPQNFIQRVDKVLLALSVKYPRMGQKFSVDSRDKALYYAETDNPLREIETMLVNLEELGFVREIGTNIYEISANGWIRIGELSRAQEEIDQGFIAMAFNDDTKKIRETFVKAISECGFIPRRIDEKEHNNQIVPEIFYEIRRSKFLVVDVTIPNYGAYYEAGYGEALGKQVILCCREDTFDSEERPHFDVAQKSTIVWTDPADLKERLERRIKATVGIGRAIPEKER